MVEKNIGSLTVLFFESLLKHKVIKHFISTRTGGVSKFPYLSLNLGLHVGDDPEYVRNNRTRLAKAIGIPLNRFTTARQIHSGNVSIISEEMRGKGSIHHQEAIKDTDAMITNVPDICLMVLVADCVPMLFFDPSRRAIGVAHAGWRGTLQFVALNTVKTMEKSFRSSPRDIKVGIGPSIGPCCYKVGPELIAQVGEVFHRKNEYIRNESKEGEGYFNLWKANLDQLLHAGIERENIEIAKLCTCHNPDLFFSYRHQREDTGRFGVGIAIEKFYQ
jgi:YfiH family protein